jgi:hypothetical protein
MSDNGDLCELWYHNENKGAEYDARGIFLTYTCPLCHEYKMARYRPDVLNNPAYEAVEDIDGDDEEGYIPDPNCIWDMQDIVEDN